jgi:DNA-binding NtrC family response regulator
MAARFAVENGASARHADGIETAVARLHVAGADLLIADVAIDIRGLAVRMDAARIQAPVVACGAAGDAAAAAAAIEAGAKEYIPLPDDPGVIAAILAAVADDSNEGLGVRESLGPRASRLLPNRPGGTPAVPAAARNLVGRTVADVERDLILATLARCLGNRTHAAGLLGISIRTLRNKLAVYAAEGVSVPPPNSGEMRGAA